MRYRFSLAVSFFLLTNLSAQAQGEAKPSFQTLLERAKQQDPKLNFQALRLAYSDSAMYNPYDSQSELQGKILKALREKKYQDCLESVEAALQRNYVDINLHFAAVRCYAELKNREKEQLHRYVLDGLIKSILGSGDGKSPESAFLVISTDEVYALLGAVRLRKTSQSLAKDKGHHYDLIIAREEKGELEYRLYFNIDRQFDWLRSNAGKLGK